MTNNNTVQKLRSMGLTGMADAYREQANDKLMANYSFDERLAMLVDIEWDRRKTTGSNVSSTLPTSSSITPISLKLIIMKTESLTVVQSMLWPHVLTSQTMRISSSQAHLEVAKPG